MKSLISTLVNAWRSSIRNQLTLAFATVTSLIMLIFNYNIIQHERDFLMKENINHTFELARAISVSSSSWLLADDVVGLQEIVLAISNPELRYAMVLSPEGRVMASHDSSLIGHYLADPISRKFLMSTPTHLTLVDTKHSLDIVTPITANQQHIGWVRIGLGRDKLNNNLRKVAIYGFFMAFLAITITIAIARWLSGKLTSKLNHVIMVANQVHAGQTNQRVQLEDMSEIGILGKDINRMLDAIQYANQRIELLLDSISDGFYGVDNQGIVTFINPAGAKMLGYEVDEIIGKDAHELIHHTHNDGSDYPSEDCKIYASSKHGIRSHVNDEVFWCKDGSSFPVEYYSDPVIEDGNIIGAVVSFNNITQQKQNEELIWHQANYDALTGLPNRRLFQEHLLQETKKAERTHQLLALLLLDIDHFKEVNDTLGHDMGDTLLLEAAQRIKNCIRETDTVARLGGDEFTVILSGVISSNDVDLIAQKILHALARPFQLGNDLSYLSASIGITLYPDDTTSLTTLLKNADQAMYSAKEAGRNRSHYFTSSMQDAMQNKALLVKGLHEAIKKQQFDVYYQPIIQIKTGHIDKAEALIRWQHPQKGLISPAEFIPLAEETGLIKDIGDWVFKQAAQQAKSWRETYNPNFQISVNQSPVQFNSGSNNATGPWCAYLAKLNLQGQGIMIEITESVLMKSDDWIQDNLLFFRDAGIQVALDDFGTAYSSLAYLKKFDIDYIKIDQSFVRHLKSGSDDLTLCKAIIVMAHTLGIKVIAEGVETQTQLELLQSIDCDYAQGYLFSKPIPTNEFEQLLLTNLDKPFTEN